MKTGPRLSGIGRFATLAVAFLCLALASAQAAPTFPPLTGRVVDNAHVLPAQTVDDLTAKLKALEDRTGRQLVVVTLPSLQGYEIEEYGYQLGRAWGIGQKGKNDGALFIIVPSEKHVRIEVGYGLEPILTDALSEVILQGQVLPKFRDGVIPGGITAGTDAIIAQLTLDAPAAKAKVAAAEGRAKAPVHINPVLIFFLILIGISLLRRMFGGARSSGSGIGWALPLLFMGSGRGGWGGGSGFGGGGFGGGGGFSGGGGSFGGGGASGSW